ncbi:MAG: diadenylate cyclase CdaA [Bacteroidales bacterium]|nr:diadenylate cyclase CdaA [Bacteroidales bacterium]MCR5192158.1 diadenylate cyclase CdaA [Bacteroidales bacterium]
MHGLPTITIVDIIDILLVAIIAYNIYKAVRGTNVLRIFWAVVIIYILWQLATLFSMKLTATILGQFISIGLILLIIVFQPEIRRFLLMVGTKTSIDGDSLLKRLRFWRKSMNTKNNTIDLEPYVLACMHMSQTKTGALIVFIRQNEVNDIIASGETIDAKVSSALLETLFFKNSPLHDGAVLVKGNTVVAARCILPVSSNFDIDPNLGLRHRSAIGVTEQLDVVSVIVSEETGAISYAVGGEIHHDVTPAQLKQYLESAL